MAVFGHEQHHASHQGGTADQRAMTLLISSEVSTRQAIAQQRGLPKAEANTFSGNGVHSARGVAHQHCSATIHAPQSAGDGDCAPLAGSVFRIFEARRKFRKFPERVVNPQPQLRAGRDQRQTNFFAADRSDINLAVTTPMQLHEVGPGRDAVVAPEPEAPILFLGCIQLALIQLSPAADARTPLRQRPPPSARAPILQQPARLPDEAR